MFFGLLSFGQWDLATCVQYALENNINVQQASIQAEILENSLQQSKLNRLPTANASANHNYNIGFTIDPFTNTFSTQTIQSNAFSINMGVTLFAANSITNSIKSNELASSASKAAIEISSNQTTWSVVFAFLRVVVAEENLKLATTQLDLSNEQLKIAEKRVASGADNKGVVLSLKSQYAADKLALTNAQNEIQLGYINLMNLLQIRDDQDFQITLPAVDNLPEMPLESVLDIYEMAVSLMPELRQAQLNVQRSMIEEQLSKSGYFPTLSAYGNLSTVYSESGGEFIDGGFEIRTIGYIPSTQEEVVSLLPISKYVSKSFNDQLRDNFGQSVGLSLSIPVFNNRRTAVAVQNAKLNSQISELGLLGAYNQLKADVTTAYTNLLAAKSSYESATINLEAQATNFDFANERFKAGLLNSTDLLNAKNLWSQAQVALIQAKYEYLIRHMVIEFYKGNPLSL